MTTPPNSISPYQSVKNCWYVVGFSKEFEPEKLTEHKVAGKVMVIWRTKDGGIAALDNRCAHKRFPLSEGRLKEDGTLECAYHGLCYNDKGRCTLIPSQMDQEIPAQAKVNSFPVIEQDGLVWVWPGDPARKDDRKPPRTPELADPDFENIDSGPMRIPANYLLLIENLLDITHFYPLHDGNIGDFENSKIPIKYEEDEVDGNRYVKTIREVRNYNQPPYLQDWFVYDVVDRFHTHQMVSPAFTRVEMRNAPPGELGTDKERGYVLYHFHTPVDEKNHIWWWCVNCKADHKSAGDPTMSTAKRVASMFPDVVAQDHWALEKQQAMFDVPDEGYSELFLKPDKALRRARQIFTQMLREEMVPSEVRGAAE
ncbi:aromatic ring-hydroxylating dioxygenase subunit alpha [Limibacillus halophilus]|uniref:Vanillate O-demethylase monooxygenase subunit n=1 Tax=Limibacillus halophilus TaxID=1579333 RepID=A0A839SYH7_9PROT|nr:aromatic ring-hydroxylating dioxygenase subunit alpha [Limibacillus halophilus]MBB3065993.1 vanillate O-demethylase monooxygenase subunit [Limibacillus halophilus]